MTRTRFQSILQNLHFSINGNDDKIDKSYKICPVIERLNKIFANSLLNSPFQDVDDKTDKSHKIRPVIENLNKVFAESLSNSPFKMLTSTYASLKVDWVWNNISRTNQLNGALNIGKDVTVKQVTSIN